MNLSKENDTQKPQKLQETKAAPSQHAKTAAKRSIDIKSMALIGLMAAITCILGPISITLPFTPIPISLTNLALCLSVFVLGMKKGTFSYLIYLLLGLVGLPVFSYFTGGAAKLFGPTGGYLIGFIFMALIAGFFIDKWFDKWYLCLCGMILGAAVCNLFGSIWLAFQNHISLGAALLAGVVPFIPGDLAKMVIALLLGRALRKALQRAHLSVV